MLNWIRRISLLSIILLSVFAAEGITTAGPVSQDPTQERPPLSEEDRRRVMQRLMDQMQKASDGQKQAPGKQAAEPGAAPAAGAAQATAQAVAPVPSIVQRAPLASEQILLQFDNVDLYEFINQVTDTLGLSPILIEPEVKGTVTLHSSAPISKQDLFPLFNLILKNNNAAMVRQGLVYQIVPTSTGLKKGLDVIEYPPAPAPVKPTSDAAPAKPGTDKKPDAAPPAGDKSKSAPQNPAPAGSAGAAQSSTDGGTPGAQLPSKASPRLATHIIRVEFVPVRDLIEALKLFMTDGGVIMPYERLNMLIVTDYSDSVAKVMEIIRLLDNSYLDADLIELIKIKYNVSTDVVDDLKKIFGAGSKDAATGIYFVSLDRLNSLLVMANSKRALGEIKRWIERLDAPSGRSIQTFIYTVENSTASNIALILSALYGGEGGGSTSSSGSSSQSGGANTPFGRASGGGGQGGSLLSGGGGSGSGGSTFGGGMSGSGGFGQGNYGGSPFSQGGGSYGGGFGSGGGGFVGGGGQQLGPRLSNTPGITAQVLRGGSFAGLQGDVRIVVDDINNSLIIQSSSADYAYLLETIKRMDVQPRQVIIDARIFEVDLTDSLSFGISANLQARTSGQHFTTGAVDKATGALSANTFAFIGDGREILAALDALRSKTKVRVLEAPSVLALDGTQAKIVVGGEFPYPGASYVGAAGGATTSVQYRETGIALLVMPRISASGTVTLEVAQEVSAPGASTPNGPTFSKTSVQTTLAVKDGDTVAIAGLIRSANTSSRSGIPFLSDIPLFGSLFGRTSRSGARTELLIMITPHVIRNRERFQEMTQELKDSLRNVGRVVDKANKEFIDDVEDSRARKAKQDEKRFKKDEKSPKAEEPPPAKKEEVQIKKPSQTGIPSKQENPEPKTEQPPPPKKP